MFPFDWTYLAADYYALLEKVALVIAVLILVSGLDDLFIDIWYWVRRIYRALAINHRYRPLTEAQLRDKPEQPIAIMVPAWLEYDVIAKMIENMVSEMDYRNYVIFVGTYRNDAATIGEVERMRRRYKQLRRVEVPHDGPTCKADCLNWVVQAIFLYEEQHDMEFAGVVLHDSEDIVHGTELKLFNYLLPRKDMIQLPVASLERNWYELVAGTYMDEFAESHTKDMVVRESAAGTVPSAGVGTCFSRRALMLLAEENRNQPFNTNSLTEDYDIGARLSRAGMRSIFVSFPVKYQVKRHGWFGLGRKHDFTMEMPMSVREFFPDTFRTAYRQKARWILGIGLQSWEQIEWRGSWAQRYLLLHDRKGVITTLVSVFAYIVGLQFVGFYLAAVAGLWKTYYPPLFVDSDWPVYLLYANMGLFAVRIVHRLYFVGALYGWEHALLSIPRLVVANFVNFAATMRAWKMFLLYLFLGKRLVWDKTMHDFPSSDQLREQRARLGELLTSWQSISEDTLQHALEEQSKTKVALGRILVSKGWLDDETLAEAIAYQANLPRGDISEAVVREFQDRLPAELCARHRILCIGTGHEGRHKVAAASMLSPEAIAEVQAALGHAPILHIVRESEIAAGLRLLRGQENAFGPLAGGAAPPPLLGDLLIERGWLQRDVFEETMKNYRPDQHGRIGDYLVDCGVIQRSVIEEAVRAQREMAAAPARTETAVQA